MKIVLVDIHRVLTSHICRIMAILGHEILIPDKTYKINNYPKPPIQNWCWNESYDSESVKIFGPNVRAASKQEILDSSVDAICIPNVESQWELRDLATKIPGIKTFYYTGNDYFKGHLPYSDGMKNIIFADQSAKKFSEEAGVPNRAEWVPFIHYEESFTPGLPNPVQIISYINDYQKNFERCWLFVNKIKEVNPEIIIENIENQPLESVKNRMLGATFGLSVKNLDGLGFSVLENMSLGRPMLLHKDCSMGKSLMRWSLPNQTCLFFNDGKDFRDIVEAAVACPEWVEGFQRSCYRRIRELVDTEKEIETLRKFLENLI